MHGRLRFANPPYVEQWNAGTPANETPPPPQCAPALENTFMITTPAMISAMPISAGASNF